MINMSEQSKSNTWAHLDEIERLMLRKLKSDHVISDETLDSSLGPREAMVKSIRERMQ